MTLISLVLVLAVFGFLSWLVLQIPMPQLIRNVIIGVIAFVLIIWVLQSLGIGTGLPLVRLK